MKILIQHLLVFVLFTLTMVIPYSCTEEVLEMTKETKILADSLFKIQEVVLVKEIDSLCNMRYEDLFANAVDSISEVRIREIDKILGN